MTGYDEALHPRGQAANAGQYRAKTNAAPNGELSPLWCANDAPHDAHSERNDFGGTNTCSGRPDLARMAPHAFDDHSELIEWGIDHEPSPLHESVAGQWQDNLTRNGSLNVLGSAARASFQRQAAAAFLQGLSVGDKLARSAASSPADSGEVEAANSVIAAFVDQHDLSDPDIPGEDPAATIGWSLGKKVPHEETIRELVIEAQRAARAEARASAIRAAAGLWGQSTEMPKWSELDTGITGPNAAAVEYLRGQIETIADTFGWADASDGEDMPKEAIYREIAAAADGGR